MIKRTGGALRREKGLYTAFRPSRRRRDSSSRGSSAGGRVELVTKEASTISAPEGTGERRATKFRSRELETTTRRV
jgi:hypothetical protein